MGFVNINNLLIHNFLDFSNVQQILKHMLKEIYHQMKILVWK